METFSSLAVGVTHVPRLSVKMLPTHSSSLRAQVEDDTVHCKVTRLLALDGHFVMTIKLSDICRYITWVTLKINHSFPLWITFSPGKPSWSHPSVSLFHFQHMKLLVKIITLPKSNTPTHGSVCYVTRNVLCRQRSRLIEPSGRPTVPI